MHCRQDPKELPMHGQVVGIMHTVRASSSMKPPEVHLLPVLATHLGCCTSSSLPLPGFVKGTEGTGSVVEMTYFCTSSSTLFFNPLLLFASRKGEACYRQWLKNHQGGTWHSKAPCVEGSSICLMQKEVLSWSYPTPPLPTSTHSSSAKEFSSDIGSPQVIRSPTKGRGS